MYLFLTTIFMFAFIGVSTFTLFTTGMFIASLFGRDPIGVGKGYVLNTMGNSLPLIYSLAVFSAITYLYRMT